MYFRTQQSYSYQTTNYARPVSPFRQTFVEAAGESQYQTRAWGASEHTSISGFQPIQQMTPPRNHGHAKMADAQPLFQNLSGIRYKPDQELESTNTYKAMVVESEYSTNNTNAKDKVVEEPPRDLIQDSLYHTRAVPSGLRSPMNGPRDRHEYARSPMKHAIFSRSPIRSPISNKTGGSLLSEFPQLEQHGISLDDFKTEKAANSEMLRMARGQLEITKLLKNALLLMKKDTPNNQSLAQQMNMKVNVLRAEVQDSKRKLVEICNTNF